MRPARSRARFTNLIAEPDASEEAVTEAVNDTLKAIAASLLMEQVLAPRFNFTPKIGGQPGRSKDVDYGEGQGTTRTKCNVGVNDEDRPVPRRDQGVGSRQKPRWRSASAMKI